MQLVREIQAGMDVDGDGTPDFDRSRNYHVGLSQGAALGTIFDAVEPAVRSAAINVGGGPLIEIIRMRPNLDLPATDPNYPSAFEFILQNKPIPSLLNVPNGTFFDNTPLRNSRRLSTMFLAPTQFRRWMMQRRGT